MDKLENAAYSLSRALCSLAASVMDYRLRVYGKNRIPEGKAIIAANHTSYLDPIFLGLAFGKLNFISRNLNSNESLLGGLFQQWLSLIGVMKIENGKIGKNCLIGIIKKLKEGKKVAMFPEGTRTIDGRLGYFNDGVALISDLSDTIVLPVSIDGTYKIWPRNGRIKYSGDVTINVCSQLYINKGISDKAERRKDLTDRIKNEIERNLYSVKP